MRQASVRWLTGLAVVTGMAISSSAGLCQASQRTGQDRVVLGRLSRRAGRRGRQRPRQRHRLLQAALAFDPRTPALQQSLMLSLIAQGRFDESLPYADKLKDSARCRALFAPGAGGRLHSARRILPRPRYWLKLSLESDLDRLITGVMTAWAKQGAGERQDAMAYLDKLQGPGMVRPVQVLPPRADRRCGRHARQRPTRSTPRRCDNVAAGGAAPETWLRAAEAYAGFLARKGDKAKALSVLDQAETFRRGKLSRSSPARQDRPRATRSRRWSPARPTVPPKSCSISPPRSIAAAASLSCASICNMRWR